MSSEILRGDLDSYLDNGAGYGDGSTGECYGFGYSSTNSGAGDGEDGEVLCLEEYFEES